MVKDPPGVIPLTGNEYITTEPTVYEWVQGQGRLRITVPAGQNTDFASVPDGPVLRRVAKVLGFDRRDPRLRRGSIIHDMICYHLKVSAGVLPDGYYQYLSPAGQWENITTPKWSRKEGDKLWRKIVIEDGFPSSAASFGYRILRIFGGFHSGISK